MPSRCARASRVSVILFILFPAQVLYSPSLHYELSRMHHNDKRVRRGLTLLPPRAWRARPGHRAPEKAEDLYRPRTSIGLRHAAATRARVLLHAVRRGVNQPIACLWRERRPRI